MSTYVISDIHGSYDKFVDLLEVIGLTDDDTLYILGDVVDRGPHPMKAMLKLMEMPNVICIAGNHELMAMDCLEFLQKEITDSSIDALDEHMLDNLSTWQLNGSETTIREFRKLDHDTRQDVIDYMGDFMLYDEVSAGGNDYLLVHAGLGGYYPGKPLDDYSLHDLVWTRPDYDLCYFPDKFVVSGHTPTQLIEGNPRPGYIFRANNHIAIDCGACFPGGRLAAICLDTGEEFYDRISD